MVSIELGVGREQGSLFDRQSYLNQHCWVSLTWKPVLVWHNSANCWEKDTAIALSGANSYTVTTTQSSNKPGLFRKDYAG